MLRIGLIFPERGLPGSFVCCVGWRPTGTPLTVDGDSSAIAFDAHIEDCGVVNEAIDGRKRNGQIGEDPVPFAERLIGVNQRGALFVACADGRGVALHNTRQADAKPVSARVPMAEEDMVATLDRHA